VGPARRRRTHGPRRRRADPHGGCGPLVLIGEARRSAGSLIVVRVGLPDEDVVRRRVAAVLLYLAETDGLDPL
jgi:hypothetical protein